MRLTVKIEAEEEELSARLLLLQSDLAVLQKSAAGVRDRAVALGKRLVDEPDSYEARLRLMEVHQRAAALADLAPQHPFLATIRDHGREQDVAESEE